MQTVKDRVKKMEPPQLAYSLPKQIQQYPQQAPKTLILSAYRKQLHTVLKTPIENPLLEDIYYIIKYIYPNKSRSTEKT